MIPNAARLAALSVLIAVASCTAAGPSGYRAIPGGSRYEGVGYSEKKLDHGRWQVVYTAGTATSEDTVANYALLRAAQLTLDRGFDRFAVFDSSVDRETETHYPEQTLPPGFEPPEDRFGATTPSQERVPKQGPITIDRIRARLVIQPYRGAAPAGASRTYDAHAVLDRLEPRLKR